MIVQESEPSEWPRLDWVQKEPDISWSDETKAMAFVFALTFVITNYNLIAKEGIKGIGTAIAAGCILGALFAVITLMIMGHLNSQSKEQNAGPRKPVNVKAWADTFITEDGQSAFLRRFNGKFLGGKANLTALREITGFSIDTATNWCSYKGPTAHVLLANLQDGSAHIVAFHCGPIGDLAQLRARAQFLFHDNLRSKTGASLAGARDAEDDVI